MLEILIIIVILAAVVGPVLFWGFIFFSLRNYLRDYQRAEAEEERLMNQIMQSHGNISPALQTQLFSAFAQAQQSMSHLKGIDRERAELRQADFIGMAAQAGIDPPSF